MNKKYILYGIIGLCLIGFLTFFYFQEDKRETTITYNIFLSSLEKGEVHEVLFHDNQNFFYVVLKNQKQTYLVPNPQTEDFIPLLLSHNVEISYKNTGNGSAFAQIFFIIAMAGGLWYFRLKQSNGRLVQDANQKNCDILPLMLHDIAGNEEAKGMVEDIIHFIKNPEKYKKVGAKMPRGILFYGPPGTGKTLMAKAIAGEAGVPFYPMNGSDFVQMYVGVGASRIRDLFKTAKKAEKAVIFIDEIDAIGKRRGKQPNSGNDERDQTLNALLTEMSGFHQREGIIVIAATNRLDTLDEALTRPGRFDRLIEIGLPDVNAREKILTLHGKTRSLSEQVKLSELAKSTVSFSGAMLENLINEAAIFAANDNQGFIKPEHMDKAFFMIIAGSEKTDTSYITPLDRRITAYHEAAHSLMTKLLLPDSYISKVTIIPSINGAGGFSLSIPKDAMYLSKRKILANLKILLAGRAAEELIFGTEEITTGASNDIEKASRMVFDFVGTYGMNTEFGLFNSNATGTDPSSEVLDLCRLQLKELYEETKKELQENQFYLHEIAHALLEKESLSGEDIDALFSPAMSHT